LSQGLRSPITGNETDHKVRIGVVGCGKMGLLHASLLNTIQSASVVALCEKSKRITRFLGKMMTKMQIVNDLEELSGLGLDAIYVTTPIPSHYSIIETVISRKIAKDVFTEKTLGSNYSQSKQLREMMQDKVSMVGYHKRFGVTFGKAKDFLNQGRIGAVQSFEAYAYSSDFASSPKSQELSTSRDGVLRDLGCHAIDLALWYFGDLEVEPERLAPKIKASDALSFAVRTSSGIRGEFSASRCMADYRMPVIGFSIKGTHGSLDVDEDKLTLKTTEGGALQWFRPSLEDNADFLLGGPEYLREDQHFVSSILAGSRTASDFSSASRVDSIIERVI
jgi:predicted dehydrogenase